MKKHALALLAIASLAAKSPISVNLNNPEYSDGVLTTSDGGVVKQEGIRIQARAICYTKTEEKQTIEASGDLVLKYGSRLFIGERLEYNFLEQKGKLYGGVTEVSGWYLGGEEIILLPDKSFTVLGAFAQTATTKEAEWDIYSGQIEANPSGQIASSGVQVRLFRFPIFWIPGFQADLSRVSEYPVRYSVEWDRGQGPQFSMKYDLYSWQNASIYGRLDYRWSRGPGGALGWKYQSEDTRTSVYGDNYYAYDTFFNDNDPNKRKKRFRLQGRVENVTKKGNTFTLLKYDRISDKNMPLDFHMEDFELNKARQTQAAVSHHQKYFLAELDVRPRINGFQGFKQELPTLTYNLLPLTLPHTGIVMENRLDLSFLDYVYSNDIDGIIPDFSSFRGEYTNCLFRPFSSNAAVFTPFGGITVIYYSNSPIEKAVSQTVFNYGANFQMNLKRDFDTFTHALVPYTKYTGLSQPTHGEQDYFIFGIEDGYHRLDMIRIGAKNDIYLTGGDPFTPTFQSDIYALGFFGDNTFSKAFPKINCDFTYNIANLSLNGRVGWNAENQVFNFANCGIEWTVNADYAFSVEFFHRSRYFWRKDDFQNYILDVTRPIPELLDSPLSDGRNTLLAKAQVKLAPTWYAQVQTHSGWGRGAREKGYTEAKVDLYTMVATNWQMRLSYMHTVRDDQVSVSFRLKN